MAPSSLSVGLAFLGGILTVLSPCVLPILPILVGRSLQSHRYGPVALVAGLVGGFAIAGSLLGFTSQWVAGFASGLRTVAISLLLLMGLLALFPALGYRFFQKLRLQGLKQPERKGLWGEVVLGSQLGLLWTPCAGPVLGSIFVLAAVQQQVAQVFGLLLAFGMGASLPLLAIAYSGRYVGRSLLKLRPYSAALQRIGGGLVAATAIAILLGWDVKVQLWLAPLFPTAPLLIMPIFK
jgi:cytochrome c-type biogenesis protein